MLKHVETSSRMGYPWISITTYNINWCRISQPSTSCSWDGDFQGVTLSWVNTVRFQTRNSWILPLYHPTSGLPTGMGRAKLSGKPDNNQCLEARQASDNVSPAVIHKTCNVDEAQQVISPMALPGILWSMHQTADRQSGEDLHNAYSSYCGAHGALSRLSYGQIFGGELGGTKSLCQFAPVIKFGVFVDSAITYDKTSSNWPDWYTLLADSPILCADGEALTGFKHQPASNKFRYECSRIGRAGRGSAITGTRQL